MQMVGAPSALGSLVSGLAACCRLNEEGTRLIGVILYYSEFNGRRLYAGLRLDYIFGLWAATSASCAVCAVAEVLVAILWHNSIY